MNRFWRAVIVIGGMLLIGAIICTATIFVLSGGRLGELVQDQLARIRLASREADLNRPIGSETMPIRFTIDPGDTPRTIAENLVYEGLIADADLFVDYARAYDIDTQLEAGVFFLYRTQTTADIAHSLTDSASSQFVFRVLEGQRLEEIAYELIDTNPFFGFSGADFFALAGPGAQQDPGFAQYVGLPAGASLEGFIFPDTYQLPAAVTPTQLRQIVTQEFINRTSDLPAQALAQGFSLYEIVTLASIIQRETVRVDEMPLISSVYRNRLREGMRLDADPTVQYGIGLRGGSWWPQITRDDYQSARSAYNTYLNMGLPPGPIASPGMAAISAALNPEVSDYLFFRARCDGSGYHNFAVTYQEHLANGC